MNLIIMCLCSFFINFSCFEVGYAHRNYPNKPMKARGDDVTRERCFSQNAETEDRTSLMNVLLEEGRRATESTRGYDRLQLILPTSSKALPYKNSHKLRKNAKKRKRKRKCRKRVRSKGTHQKSTKQRHSKNKLSKHEKFGDKRHFRISFENQPEEDSGQKSERLYLPIHNFVDLPENEVGGESKNFSMKISELRNRRIPKGLKGGKGKRRHFNPHRGAKKVIVRTHNILRSRVWPPAQNMLAMSWNSEAAEQAQLWADECRLGTETDHPSVRWTSMHGTCGQNAHVAFKKKRWGRVVRHWWNDKRFFRYGLSGNNVTKVGKYTQMAWYNSHKVGCGFAQCETPSNKTFYRYVCNYCPGGNDPRRLSHPYAEGSQCESCPSSCRSVCNRGGCKLCTNSCAFANLWANCESLAFKWKQWLCNTKTRDGVVRFKNCRATCQCPDKIT